jgi:lipid-A-disaccharide synthase
MIKEGLNPLFHVRDLGVTGFVEVIKHLSFFRTVMSRVVNEVIANKPNAAILIDYPGFNLRLGLKLKALGVPVYYYISPQVWAWKKNRIKVMRQFIKRIFVIFPFELDFYSEQNIPVSFAGHPLVDKMFNLPEKSAFFRQYGLDAEKPLLALLPGSRRNELSRHSRPLIDAVKLLRDKHSDLQVVLAGVSTLENSYYESFKEIAGLVLIHDDPYPLISFANVAIVASGTASLETAYLGTPLLVIYRVSPLSYLIGKLLIKIDHLAMPNLILGERAIPELIQRDANPRTIAGQTTRLLSDSNDRRQMLEKLKKLKTSLGKSGCANKIATQILTELG